MIELKFTGNSVQELYNNATSVLALLVAGDGALRGAVTQPVTAAKPLEGEVILPEKPSKKREVKPTVEAKPAQEHNDPIPDMTGKGETKAVEYKLEDCRARTKAIIKKFEDDAYMDMKKDRKDATQAEIDAVMQSTMAFVVALFKPFGIKKAPDLKPEQFAEFMAATEKHV